MAIGLEMSCVRYLLFGFNFLFTISGLVILFFGIHAEVKPYFTLAGDTMFSAVPIVLIIVGLIIFVVAFFGCCGAYREDNCMIMTFSAFLLIILVAEMAVGIAGYAGRQTIEATVKKSLNESITKYPTDKFIKATYDLMQTDLECCGVNGPQDWPAAGLPIPDSCCSVHKINDVTVKCDLDSDFIFKDSCLSKLVMSSTVLSAVCIGVAVIQLIGVTLACCLARSIRSQYETV